MGCRELEIEDYFHFVGTKPIPKKSHSHVRNSACTPKNAYSRFSHTVISNYRYYCPELGRWLSRDPIGERGGVNLYGMAGNNSVIFVDYFGLLFGKGEFFGRQGFLDSVISTVLGTRGVASGVHALIRETEPSMKTYDEMPQEPSTQDHYAPEKGGVVGESVNNTLWFEQNYPGWVNAAKTKLNLLLKTDVEDNCPTKDTNIDTQLLVLPVYPFYGKVRMGIRYANPDQNETKYGDKPQSRYWAGKVLGSFNFHIRNIQITYSGPDFDGVITYSYKAELVVGDTLGLQSHDGASYLIFGSIFPSRPITRASWTISGDGNCCEKK